MQLNNTSRKCHMPNWIFNQPYVSRYSLWIRWLTPSVTVSNLYHGTEYVPVHDVTVTKLSNIKNSGIKLSVAIYPLLKNKTTNCTCENDIRSQTWWYGNNICISLTGGFHCYNSRRRNTNRAHNFWNVLWFYYTICSYLQLILELDNHAF